MLARLLPLLFASHALAIPASTRLTLVEGEPGFNVLTVTVDPDTPIPLPDTDTAFLTGTVAADFDIDPDTGKTSEFTLREGRADASEMNFANRFIVGYNVTATDLSAAVATAEPPGEVDEASGDFDASQHRFAIDRGTISGTALGEAVDLTLDPTDPFEGFGSGTGKVVLTLVGTTGLYHSFDVVATVPVSVSDTFDASGTAVGITATGTLKAIGTVQVPSSEYLAWTIAESIPGADGQADTNGDGMPNAIAWALGLGALEDARAHRLRPANGGFELRLPPAGTIAPITIQGSDLSSAWTPVASDRLLPAANPLPPGSTGLITISRATGEFLRLSVEE